MPTFTLEKNVAAPPSTVFEVLADHRNYSAINGRIRSSTLEREGEPAPNGVGAIRVLKAIGPPLREEIVEYRARRAAWSTGCSQARRCATTWARSR